MCWSLKLDDDLVLLEVNDKKSEILKLEVGLLIDLIKNSISDNSRAIIRGSSLSLISLSLSELFVKSLSTTLKKFGTHRGLHPRFQVF